MKTGWLEPTKVAVVGKQEQGGEACASFTLTISNFLRARRIPAKMPERIYREAKERYYCNHATFRHIAVMSMIYHRRRRKDG